MEKLEPITLNLGCRREIFTYEVDWALETGPDGNNYLPMYSEIVNPIIRSGKKTCTTGPLAGEGNYFEFFLNPSTEDEKEFLVHVQCCYPNRSRENERYTVVSGKLFSVDDKAVIPEFSIGEFSLQDDSPIEDEETEDESTVSWLSLDVQENIKVEFKDGYNTKYTYWNQSMYKTLTFRIRISKESWGNYPVKNTDGSGLDDTKNKDFELNMNEASAPKDISISSTTTQNSTEKASNGLMNKIASLWISPALPEPGDKFSLV